MKKIISELFNYLVNDSLCKNSIYLILSTGVLSLFGFFFWIINARLYSAEQVGIGTTLISIMTLISSFSILGIGNGLIRYLPSSERKNRKINTSFSIVALMSVLISLIYLLFLKTFSPILLFIRENIVFYLFFILSIVFFSLNTISENIFIAYLSSKFIFIKNIVSSIAKLILPILLVSVGSYGIFLSMGISTILAFLLSLIFLILHFNYSPKLMIDASIVKRMTKFSLGNYVAGFVGSLPTMVLPILITNLIGSKFSAYFYMDMMIANLLYIIPTSTSQSFFAESSHNEKELKTQFKKAIKLISLIFIPAIFVIYFFGNYILIMFGKEYSKDGFVLLKYLSVSGILMIINAIGSVILNIKHKITLLILMSFISATLVILLSIFLIKIIPFSLTGVGIAWLFGHAATSLIYLFLMKKMIL